MITFVIFNYDYICKQRRSGTIKEIPKISEAEWRIMKLLWQKNPQTAKELIPKLPDSVKWSPKTVKTLLNRLVNKKVLDFHTKGRIYEYFPNYTEEECLENERNSFLSRIYNGALKPMLVAFLEDNKLSKKDIEELKRILNEERTKKS
jgi:BlaI family penicillinase repressor